MERVRGIRSQFNQGTQRRLESAGVKVVCAEAAFTGERTVSGGGMTVQAPIIVINMGTSSALPAIPGLAGTPYLTNRNFFDVPQLPPRLLVVGGGYIALELGQGMARLGSQTELIVRGDRLLAQEEPDVSAVLADAFKQDAIGLHFNTTVQQVAHGNGVFTLTLNTGKVLKGEALLIATGRRPTTGALNSAATGVELDAQGFIKIDDQFQRARF